MPSPLNKIKVRRKVLETFSLGKDPVDAAKGISDEELVEMLDAVLSLITNPKKRTPNEVEMLVFAGSVRFDRWFTPSPFVVKRSQRRQFRKFVAAMKHIESSNSNNYPVFAVHELRDELYEKFGDLAAEKYRAEELETFEARLSRIQAPSERGKLKEFNEQRIRVERIIKGMCDGTLRTTMTFKVPYIIHKHCIDLKFVRDGAAATMKIKPQFRPVEETFLTVDGVALSIGASRWQTGISEVTLELPILIDGSAYSRSLQSIFGHDLPTDGWPRSFTTAFEIFHDIVWTIRGKSGFRQDWIPAPRDISDLTFQLGSSADEKIEWIIKGSPASLLEAFSPSGEVEEIDLGDLAPIPWDLECKGRAQMYLELGDTNEALFWINVSVEALISKRFDEIEEKFGFPGLANKLNSPKEFWSGAEEIIEKQQPHMAGKIQWPTSQIHISIFGKIKALYRLVSMKTTHKELIKRYRTISGDRNDLFHGKRIERTTVEMVFSAFESLEWIRENMWPEETS
jgi:hypothetical protein